MLTENKKLRGLAVAQKAFMLAQISPAFYMDDAKWFPIKNIS
jgi:hypothetical protein